MYAPGILWDHHVFWWLYTWGWTGIVTAENWGWIFEYTPAFIGAGILSGMNASWSFFGGEVLAWALIGPVTIKYGATFGKNVGEYGLMNYNDLKFKRGGGATLDTPSPRFWNIWVGVMIMLCASFAEVAMNGPMLYRGMKRAFFETAEKIPKTRAFAEKHLSAEEQESDDPSPKSEQVPTWAWSSGVLLSITFSMIVLAVQYKVNPGLTILAVLMAFIFSFIAAQSSGATDINPVSTCAKSSQLVFGGITQGQGIRGPVGSDIAKKALSINMTAGIVAGGAAAQSVDMLGDLRTGYLLSASPYAQFVAQAFGSFFSIFLCTGFFVLFSAAYPCIVNEEIFNEGHCEFALPSVQAWKAVGTAVTGENFPVPKSSAITALVFGIVSVIIVVTKYKWSKFRRSHSSTPCFSCHHVFALCILLTWTGLTLMILVPTKYWHWVPNMNAVGLAFTLPQTQYATAMAVGATASYIWLKRSPRTWNDYAYSIAAGFSAGEGIGGTINAVLQVAGVAGDKYGSAVACPGFEYCG